MIKEIIVNTRVDPDAVHIFGSRAMGTYKQYSDIDLVILNDVSQKQIDTMWTIFNESSIPYKVDICAYHLLNVPALKQHIDLVSAPIFSQTHSKSGSN